MLFILHADPPLSNLANCITICGGGPNCTGDLLVMSQARYYFSTPRYGRLKPGRQYRPDASFSQASRA